MSTKKKARDMNELKVFSNEVFGAVRILEVNGEPWFVGKDICEVLGYSRPSDAIAQHVDEDEKLTRQITVLGQKRNMYVINESGLYSLIIKSKKKEAKQFKKWVTSEVLPNIRKHGAYMTPITLENAIANPDFMIGLLQELKEEQSKNLMLEQRVAELEPKETYYDQVLKSASLMTITSIAKDYGMSGKALNKLLHDLKIQFKQGDTWFLYAKYQKFGYTKSETHTNEKGFTKLNTKWTQQGRLFIYDLLKENGILPTIEKNDKEDK